MAQASPTGTASRTSRALGWPLHVLRRLVSAVPAAIDGYFVDRCPQFAAGIAYRVLFSIAPLAIVLVSVFGLILQNDELRQDVVDSIVDALPITEEGGQQVEEAITRIASPTSAVGLLSLFVFAWAATGMMAAIRTGLEAAMQVQRGRPAAHGKLVDLILIVGAAALVLVAVGLNVVLQVVGGAAERAAELVGADGSGVEPVLATAGPVLVSAIVVLLLYRFVPAQHLRFHDAVAGAFVTSVLFLLVTLAAGWTLEKVSRLSIVYGSLTGALVFLYAVYLYASALLFGAEVASAWSRPAGPSQPLRTQVRRAAKGLFVHQEPPAPAGHGDERPPPV